MEDPFNNPIFVLLSWCAMFVGIFLGYQHDKAKQRKKAIKRRRKWINSMPPEEKEEWNKIFSS